MEKDDNYYDSRDSLYHIYTSKVLRKVRAWYWVMENEVKDSGCVED